MARPLIEFGEVKYLMYEWFVMVVDPTTNQFQGSVGRASEPRGGKIMHTFQNATSQSQGYDSHSVTLNDGVDISLMLTDDDDDVMALMTGSAIQRVNVGASNERRETTLPPGLDMPYLGVIIIGLTVGGGYCTIVAPRAKVQSLGEGTSGGDRPELPSREITMRGLATNINGGDDFWSCRKVGFRQAVSTLVAPIDATTFASFFADISTNTPPTAAPTGATVTAGTDQLTFAATAVPSAQNGGSDILFYYLQFKPSAASVWTTLVITDIAGTDITGLTTSTQYDVRAAAVNALGVGPYTAVVQGTPT